MIPLMVMLYVLLYIFVLFFLLTHCRFANAVSSIVASLRLSPAFRYATTFAIDTEWRMKLLLVLAIKEATTYRHSHAQILFCFQLTRAKWTNIFRLCQWRKCGLQTQIYLLNLLYEIFPRWLIDWSYWPSSRKCSYRLFPYAKVIPIILSHWVVWRMECNIQTFFSGSNFVHFPFI